MVQVDVFWSYAIGAGFAAAASRQIVAAAKSAPGGICEEGNCPLENRYFTITVIYLATLFAPSGIGLLWAFPSWETMHAGGRGLPAWLVMLFAVTNVTQGILGFWVTKKLFEAGKNYLASLQMIFGYVCMFFILVHGWDGTGYKRFFSSTPEAWQAWKWTNIPAFAVSDVALTLYSMGVVLMPILFYLMTGWILKGREAEGSEAAPSEATRVSLARIMIRLLLAGALGLAVAASILIHLLGWILGLIVWAALAYALALRRGAFIHSWLAEFLLREKAFF